MQVGKESGRGRTYRHIFFSFSNSLPFVTNDVLIRSIRSLRDSVEVLYQKGAAEEDRRYLGDIRRALAKMEREARRRGLDLPEESSPDD